MKAQALQWIITEFAADDREFAMQYINAAKSRGTFTESDETTAGIRVAEWLWATIELPQIEGGQE